MTTATLPHELPASSIDERDVTFRKIIWRLIPYLTLVWFLAWIDRVNSPSKPR